MLKNVQTFYIPGIYTCMLKEYVQIIECGLKMNWFKAYKQNVLFSNNKKTRDAETALKPDFSML